MKYNLEVILLFLRDEALKTSAYSWIYDRLIVGKHLYQAPDPRRKEVVKELDQRLALCADQVFFNAEIIYELFDECIAFSQDYIIYPVVGLMKGYDCILTLDPEGHHAIIVDLLQFADYGPELDKMMYMMRSMITDMIVKKLCRLYYPSKFVKGYQDLLIYHTFNYGLSQYLAWGPDIQNYLLKTEKYEEYRDRSLTLLHQALVETDGSSQEVILKYAFDNDFWNRFGVISGMFLWDYVYENGGKDAILYTYKKGWKTFIKK